MKINCDHRLDQVDIGLVGGSRVQIKSSSQVEEGFIENEDNFQKAGVQNKKILQEIRKKDHPF